MAKLAPPNMTRYLAPFLLLLCSQAVAQSKLQQTLDAYKDSLPNYGIVAVLDHGKGGSMAATGWAAEATPMQATHRFCIGSATKLFTAVLILQLQDAGQLSIDDPIGKYIAKHQFIDGSITIRQLLNHTSGIADIVDANLANTALKEPNVDYSDVYLLNRINAVDFEKGSQYAYSNSNYFLLRTIIALSRQTLRGRAGRANSATT